MLELRPSAAGRWVNCPASPRLEQPFPDDESPEAAEGTAAHWLAAQVLGGHFQADELIDRQAPNGVIITGDMVDHTRLYIENAIGPGAVIERAQVSAIDGIADGTPDAVRVADDHGWVWDLKYGWSIVEAVSNWQGACYVVNLFDRHNWSLKVVTFFIVQPRPFHPEGRIRTWTVTADEARTLRSKLHNAAIAAQQPDAPAVTGEHCRDCKALHMCESARRAGLNAVDVSLRGVNTDQPPDAMGAELKELHRAKTAITQRLDALEKHTMSTIDNGGIVPGWSVDRAFGKRQWTVPIATVEALTGVKLTEDKPLTPAAAERNGVDKTLVEQFTRTPETGRKLVARDAAEKAARVFNNEKG